MLIGMISLLTECEPVKRKSSHANAKDDSQNGPIDKAEVPEPGIKKQKMPSKQKAKEEDKKSGPYKRKKTPGKRRRIQKSNARQASSARYDGIYHMMVNLQSRPITRSMAKCKYKFCFCKCVRC